jgi:hypothetical protein
MIKRLLESSVLVALFTVVLFSGAAQGQQKYMGLAQAGAAPVGTEEPCILNPCLLYAGERAALVYADTRGNTRSHDLGHVEVWRGDKRIRGGG